MPDYPTSNDGVLIEHFRNYVRNGINTLWWAQDAYQLFAHNDLSGVYGTGHIVDSYEGWIENGTEWMTSILEAHDHSFWDSYDPDRSDHLGIVSATELGRVYGEWEHPQDCTRDWAGFCREYNVMASGNPMSDRGFWFTSQSKARIQHDPEFQL